MKPICANCGQAYTKHQAFMENCPTKEGFSKDKFYRAVSKRRGTV